MNKKLNYYEYNARFVTFLHDYLKENYRFIDGEFFKFLDLSRKTVQAIMNPERHMNVSPDWFRTIDFIYEKTERWVIEGGYEKKGPKYKIKNYDEFHRNIVNDFLRECEELVPTTTLQQNILRKKTFGEFVYYMLQEGYQAYKQQESSIHHIQVQKDQIHSFIHQKLEIFKKKNTLFTQVRDVAFISSDPELYSYMIKCACPSNFSVANDFYLGVYLGKSLSIEKIREAKKGGLFGIVFVVNPEFNYIRNEDLIGDGIYIECIKTRKVENLKKSEFFLYHQDIDAEALIALNKITDHILNRMKKYYDIILNYFLYDIPYLQSRLKVGGFKNLQDIFMKEGSIVSQKMIDHCQIQFENQLIKKVASSNKQQTIVLFGHYGFASVVNMLDSFGRIIILSDSIGYVKTFNQLMDYNKNISQKIKCCWFYGGISNHVITTEKLYNEVDLIVVGNGSGSMIHNMKKYLLYFNLMLKPGGNLIFSCINKSQEDNEFVNSHLNYYIHKNKFYYQLEENLIYEVFGRTYKIEHISHELERVFAMKEFYTFPASSLKFDSQYQEAINQYYEVNIDYAFSHKSVNNKNGYFVYIVLYKDQTSDMKGYRIPEKFSDSIIPIHHSLILNTPTQLNQLQRQTKDIDSSNLLKTLVLETTQHNRKLVICLPMKKNLKTNDEIFTFNDEKYKLVSIHTLNKYGIKIGNISPFVLHDLTHIDYYFDQDILYLNKVYVYFGDNNLMCTYKMKRTQFIDMLKEFGYQESDMI